MTTIKIAAIATLLATLAAPVLAEGDAEKGEKVFKKCKACHMVGDKAKNKVGPHLNSIIGAPVAQNPDFKYSKVMIAAGEDGMVWDTENLTGYLTSPKKFMKGNKMSFSGLRKEADIENVLAYLATFE